MTKHGFVLRMGDEARLRLTFRAAKHGFALYVGRCRASTGCEMTKHGFVLRFWMTKHGFVLRFWVTKHGFVLRLGDAGPFVADWRWLLNRQDSAWYPSMRLFRQKNRGDWATVFDEIHSALRELV